MSDFLLLVVIFFAAVNPPAVVVAAERIMAVPIARRAMFAAAATGLAFTLYLLAAAPADTYMDWLEIAPESFRVAAGIIMAMVGAFAVWRARVGAAPADPGWLAVIAPLALPLLAGPAGLIAAISYGADEGAGRTIGAATIALAVAGLLLCIPVKPWRPFADGLARLLGALLVVAAASLTVEGVRDI